MTWPTDFYHVRDRNRSWPSLIGRLRLGIDRDNFVVEDRGDGDAQIIVSRLDMRRFRRDEQLNLPGPFAFRQPNLNLLRANGNELAKGAFL